jgi:hypothetical protein
MVWLGDVEITVTRAICNTHFWNFETILSQIFRPIKPGLVFSGRFRRFG